MLPSGILTCCTGPFWSDSLCLSGFCLPSLWCVVSALTQTQAGGGDLLFGFASSVQSWGGEGGALQADVAVCGEHWPCPGRAARGLARSLHGHAAPPPSTASASRRRKSSDRNRGRLAGWEGAASLGLSFPLAPPPASYLLRVVFIFQPGWLKDSSTDKETLTQYTVIYSRPHY